MSHISPGGTSGYVPVWDGSKWTPAPQVTGIGAAAPSIFHGKRVKWLDVFGGGSGSTGVTGWTSQAVAGTNDIPVYTKTDSFLCLPWYGVKTSVSTAGANACYKNAATDAANLYLGSVANSGGLYWRGRLGLPTSATWASTNGSFLGFRASLTNPAGGTLPSAFVDCMGFGHDSGDTTLQFMCNDASGTCTKTSCTGLTLAAKTAYDVEIYVAPNSATVNFKATDITNNVAFSSSVSSNTPTAYTTMGWFVYCTNGVTAVTAGIAWGGQYIEAN